MVLSVVLFGGGLEEDELDAVMGCDSAAGAEGISGSVGLGASPAGDGDRWVVDEGSTGCGGSCGGESVPSAGGNEACAEPDMLERREISFDMSRYLTAGFNGIVPVVKRVWKRFPQVGRARSAGVQGYRPIVAGPQPIRVKRVQIK